MNIKRYLVEAAIDDINWDTKNPNEFKSDFINYLNNRGLKDAAKLLEKFKPQFVKYYAECAGKNPLSDNNNLFLRLINQPAAYNVINNEDIFMTAYNLTLDTSTGINVNYINTGKSDDCILYFIDFYRNIESDDVQAEILALDINYFNNKGLGAQGQERLRNAIRDRSISQFLRTERKKNQSTARQARTKTSDVTDKLKNMSREELKNVMQNLNLGDMADSVATAVYNANSTKD